MHPNAFFFSKKLRQAERNYDVGNRELLALKLALEEWQHWLEGAQQPFLVLPDHKNLEYLHTAKRLNPRQAYQLGSKNGKADVLSRTNSKANEIHNEKTILSPTCWINTIDWE